MTRYVALLRAVNVGGTGKLPMTVLRSICATAGCTKIETYIASGNVVFDSKAAPAKVKADLEAALLAYAGKPIIVLLRTSAEMLAVLKANPFVATDPKHTYAVFLDHRPPRDALDHATGRIHEELHLGDREIYIHYGSGMGRSKLEIPAAKLGTARNMNTVATLAEMALKS